MLYKLKSFGICGNLLNLIKHYLTDRSQRVLLNGQCSNWQPILAGVPQGSILGPTTHEELLLDTSIIVNETKNIDDATENRNLTAKTGNGHKHLQNRNKNSKQEKDKKNKQRT